MEKTTLFRNKFVILMDIVLDMLPKCNVRFLIFDLKFLMKTALKRALYPPRHSARKGKLPKHFNSKRKEFVGILVKNDYVIVCVSWHGGLVQA